MRVALIGPPQSGKTTLFAAITGHEPSPAQIGQEQLAVVKVPDPRLPVLGKMFGRDRLVPATLDVIDFPGVDLTAPHAQAEFRRHAANMRTCDGLVAVLREFASDAVPPYRGRIDPAADLEELRSELAFADLEVAANRVDRLRKQITKPTPTQDHDRRELALLERCQAALENDRPISAELRGDEERAMVSSFAFLTQRPLVIVVNVGESDVGKPASFHCPGAAVTLALSAEIEAEIAQLDEADRPAFMTDLGITEPARDSLLRACYEALGLISFLTVGDDEVRAWAIPCGATAVEAAGKVHTDMARGFIRAETVPFNDLVVAGDMKDAKAAGRVRLEGKTYVVQDGDVINFRFNV